MDALRRVKIHGQLFVFFLHEAVKYSEGVNHGKPPPEGDSTGESDYTIIILIGLDSSLNREKWYYCATAANPLNQAQLLPCPARLLQNNPPDEPGGIGLFLIPAYQTQISCYVAKNDQDRFPKDSLSRHH